jgi:hypothetical protein
MDKHGHCWNGESFSGYDEISLVLAIRIVNEYDRVAPAHVFDSLNDANRKWEAGGGLKDRGGARGVGKSGHMKRSSLTKTQTVSGRAEL